MKMLPKQITVRLARLQWIKDNLDVSKYDPYNIYHVTDVVDKLMSAGLVRYVNNINMIHASTINILKQARKERGLK